MDKRSVEMATQLRHELHQHPELPMEEVWTRNHLMDFLRANTKLEVVDRGLWFYAKYSAGPDKPTIAFRSEIDAVLVEEKCDIPWKSQIPGVAHKCGHDGHAATLSCLALEIDRVGADSNVIFIFQHAEEIGLGAKESQVIIREQNVDEVYAFHNMPGFPKDTVVLNYGTSQCASNGVTFFFTGHPSHASMPELGINPAFAISELVLEIPKIIDPVKWSRMVLLTVIYTKVGEPAFGVSPGDGEIGITYRAETDEDINELTQQLEAVAKGLAEKHNLGLRYEYQESFPDTVSHRDSVDKVAAACEKLGIPTMVHPVPNRWADDFGYYTKLVPGAMFQMGAGYGPAVHTYEYDFDDGQIEPVTEIFKLLVKATGLFI